MTCGAPLAVPVPQLVASTDERKVVTALFCDLVGSTELADGTDPEDVDALLRGFHARAKTQIERYGGSVEKFIGDAVVGVFGVPVTHEDDAERAVRAALDLLEELAASELGLHVRIGLMTGETLVHRDVDPSSGVGLATGDTLNIAARLQGHAPVDGILVGDPTRRVAGDVFAWEDGGVRVLKGRAEPLQTWLPRAVADERSSSLDLTPLVGRDEQLARLVNCYETSSGSRSFELVSLVSQAGLGKSRLVRELRRHATAQPDPPAWLLGRCLPYGDGVGFWPLGEIVASYAGILDSDTQSLIAAKLDHAISEPDPALRSWMRDRLGPLVGLSVSTLPPQQDEMFGAWRRFLQSVAEHRPLVLVIEDLHWADGAMVEFLLTLAREPVGGPITLLVTARTDIADRHPHWLERARGSTYIELASLPDDSIAEMLHTALAGGSPELLDRVVDRAAGSPLYAEQLAAMLRDRPETSMHETAVPPTVQALLAARIDALPSDLKSDVLDACVVGRHFWSGAVAALADSSERDVEPGLRELARREFTRLAQPSAMEGETEYAFWHALLRDVAYGQLPRRVRMHKHAAAAVWIIDRTGGTAGRAAEIVVDHYTSALDLAGALGAPEATSYRHALVDALRDAAKQAMTTQPARAVAHLQRALALTGMEDPRTTDLLLEFGKANYAIHHYLDALEPLLQARERLTAHGGTPAAAQIATLLANTLANAGDPDRAATVLAEARDALDQSPGPILVDLMGAQAMQAARLGLKTQAARAARDAVALAGELGIPAPPRALMALGRDEDFVRAIESADAQGDVQLGSIGRFNRGVHYRGDGEKWLQIIEEAISFYEVHGMDAGEAHHLRLAFGFMFLGRWYDQTTACAEILRTAQANGDAWTLGQTADTLLHIRLARGEPVADLIPLVEGWAEAGDAERGWTRAAIALSLDDPAGALQGLRLIEGEHEAVAGFEETWRLADRAICAGDRRLARALTDILDRELHQHAHDEVATVLADAVTAVNRGRLEEADGDRINACRSYGKAMAAFDRYGWDAPGRGVRVWIGRCRLAEGDRATAVDLLAEARRRAVTLGLAPTIAEIDGLIGRSATAG
jgi:class 3 adenylate cyclase